MLPPPEVSCSARLVSGGDVLARVHLPRGTRFGEARVTLDGERIRPDAGRAEDGSWLMLVDGLRVGRNVIGVRVGGSTDELVVVNHRPRGPVFSGPQQRPFFCETTAFGLDPAERPPAGPWIDYS